MTVAAERIPFNLNKNQSMAVPLFLRLGLGYGRNGKWMEVVRSRVDVQKSYLLPPPKGIHISTQTNNSNEVQFWQLSLSQAAQVAGSNIVYTAASSLTNFFKDKDEQNDQLSVGGGLYLPADLTRIQFRGSRKRGYQFGFELWAMNAQDATSIKNFVRTMHAATMTQVVEQGRPYPFKVPPFVVFDIVGSDGETNYTNEYFVDPQPCTIVALNTTTLHPDPIVNANNKSGRMVVNMTLLEVEPTAWEGPIGPDGKVVQQWQRNTCDT